MLSLCEYVAEVFNLPPTCGREPGHLLGQEGGGGGGDGLVGLGPGYETGGLLLE